MNKIAVVHPDLNKKGGAEAVCMNILNALASHYTVELITLTNPQRSELQSYYELSFSADSVFTQGRIGPFLEQVTTRLSHIGGVGNLGVLDAALINRIARRRSSEYDLIISSMAEMYFKTPSIQYIHYPNFYRKVLNEGEAGLYGIYEYICQKISKADNIPQDSTTYIANSEWTAKQFQQIYGERPRVVYPPVDTEGFHPVPWHKREEGILVVGRIAADKRLIDILDTYKSLKQNRYDGILRIVGPIHDEEYYRRVQEKAESIQDVFFQGAVSRSDLVSLMSTHRYAIHGKREEHFGMVVAEFIAAGMIPFVPDSGGQPEIVANDPMLLYNSWETLQAKMETVLMDYKLQQEIRGRLPDIKACFGAERFREEIQYIVKSDSTLNG